VAIVQWGIVQEVIKQLQFLAQIYASALAHVKMKQVRLRILEVLQVLELDKEQVLLKEETLQLLMVAELDLAQH